MLLLPFSGHSFQLTVSLESCYLNYGWPIMSQNCCSVTKIVNIMKQLKLEGLYISMLINIFVSMQCLNICIHLAFVCDDSPAHTFNLGV